MIKTISFDYDAGETVVDDTDRSPSPETAPRPEPDASTASSQVASASSFQPRSDSAARRPVTRVVQVVDSGQASANGASKTQRQVRVVSVADNGLGGPSADAAHSKHGQYGQTAALTSDLPASGPRDQPAETRFPSGSSKSSSSEVGSSHAVLLVADHLATPFAHADLVNHFNPAPLSSVLQHSGGHVVVVEGKRGTGKCAFVSSWLLRHASNLGEVASRATLDTPGSLDASCRLHHSGIARNIQQLIQPAELPARDSIGRSYRLSAFVQVGAQPYTTSLTALIQVLVAQLHPESPLINDAGANVASLGSEFARCLRSLSDTNQAQSDSDDAETGAAHHVFVVASLHRVLHGRKSAPEVSNMMSWLPATLPDNVTIIVTSAEDALTKVLCRRPHSHRVRMSIPSRPQRIEELASYEVGADDQPLSRPSGLEGSDGPPPVAGGSPKLQRKKRSGTLSREQAASFIRTYKVKRFAGLFTKLVVPAEEGLYFRLIASFVSLCSPDPDEASARAKLLPKDKSIHAMALTLIRLIIRLSGERGVKALARSAMASIASSQTGLTLMELVLVSGCPSEAIMKDKVLPLLAPLLQPTTRVATFIHPIVQQVVLAFSYSPSASTEQQLNDAPFEYSKPPTCEDALPQQRSLWRLFLAKQATSSSTSSSSDDALRIQHELAGLPASLRDIHQASQLSPTSPSFFVAIASPRLSGQELDLANNPFIKSHGVDELCQALRCNGTIFRLNLNHDNLNDAAAERLGQALQSNNALQSLSLEGNQGISLDGAIALAVGLPSSVNVEGLPLWSAARQVASLKNQTATHLQFDESVPLTAKAIQTILKCMHGNKHLTQVTFCKQPLTDADVATMAPMLGSFRRLTSLSLKKCQLTNDAVFALAPVLKKHPSIRTLDLSYNKLRDDSGSAFAQILLGKAPLSRLDIGDNLLQDKGSRALADALKANSKLKELSLNHNKYITIMGVRYFADALRENKTLSSFSFRDNIGTGDNGASVLADALRHNNTLEELNMRNCNLRKAGRAALEAINESHPSCRVLY